jgi:hypothetical protein
MEEMKHFIELRLTALRFEYVALNDEPRTSILKALIGEYEAMLLFMIGKLY